MDLTEIIIAAFGLIGIVLPSYWAYLEKTKNKNKDIIIAELERRLEESKQTCYEHELRTAVVEKLLDITLLGDIQRAVALMFQETKAERFLILIAINGKIDFNYVSVIFEQHKGSSHVNAIARYKNISIDIHYKEMLKKSERIGVVNLDIAKMPEDSLLKNIYDMEGIKHAKIRHLLRERIDTNNDVVIFSSIATFQDEAFTLAEKTLFLTQYDSQIVPALKKMVEAEDLKERFDI